MGNALSDLGGICYFSSSSSTPPHPLDAGGVFDESLEAATRSLQRIVGTERLKITNTEFWDVGFETMELRFDRMDDHVALLIRDACQSLAQNTPFTGNFRTLVLVLCETLEGLEPNLEFVPPKALNLLVIARIIIQFFIRESPPEERRMLFSFHFPDRSREPTRDPASDASGEGAASTTLEISEESESLSKEKKGGEEDNYDGDLCTRLCRALMDVCIDSSLSGETYDLHLEVVDFLLCLLSTQMFGGQGLGFEDNVFLDCMVCTGDCQERAPELVQTLLYNFMDRAFKDPSETEGEADAAAPGLLWRLGSTIATPITTVAYLPVRMMDYFFPNPVVQEYPLADHSALLFLVLTHQSPVEMLLEHEGDEDEGDTVFINPYRDALAALNNDQHELQNPADAGDHSQMPAHVWRLSFARLRARNHFYPFLYQAVRSHMTPLHHRVYEALGCGLKEEWSALLLYSLMHGNSAFCEYVYSKTDLDSIVLPLLETLYTEKDLKTNRVYMLLIILLILSQDQSFGDTVHRRLTRKTVPWFKESVLTDISVGSLMMIVLLRILQLNLSNAMRDAYLHTNCLAALANMAPHCTNMHPYCAQKLTSLLELLSKKYLRLQEQQGADGEKNADEMATFSDFTRLVLEITHACLSPDKLAHNSQLVYWLLHRKKILLAFEGQNSFVDLVRSIQKVVAQFEQAIQKKAKGGSVEKVLKTIKSHAKSRPVEVDPALADAHTKFSYEEQENAQDFFLPYIWTVTRELGVITDDGSEPTEADLEGLPGKEEVEEDLVAAELQNLRVHVDGDQGEQA